MNKKILIVPTLIAGITIGFATFSFAAKQGEISATSVNFRESASQTSNIIQSLNKGSKVTIDGEEGDFYKVTYNSKQGYISKQFVKVSDNDSQNTSTANTTTNNTTSTNTTSASSNTANTNTTTSGGNIDTSTVALTEEEAIKKNETSLKNEQTLYALPLINSSEIATLAKDEKVTLVSVNGKWAYVRGSKNSGWVDKNSLSSVSIYLPSGASTETNNNENVVNQETVAETNTQVEQKAESNTVTSNETTNTASANTSVNTTTANTTTNTTSSNTSNATKATNTTSASTTSSSSSSSKTMYVNVDSVNIRDQASTSSEIIGSLEKNNSITVTSTQGEWSRIKTSSGASGYILSKYLSANKS